MHLYDRWNRISEEIILHLHIRLILIRGGNNIFWERFPHSRESFFQISCKNTGHSPQQQQWFCMKQRLLAYFTLRIFKALKKITNLSRIHRSWHPLSRPWKNFHLSLLLAWTCFRSGTILRADIQRLIAQIVRTSTLLSKSRQWKRQPTDYGEHAFIFCLQHTILKSILCL